MLGLFYFLKKIELTIMVHLSHYPPTTPLAPPLPKKPPSYKLTPSLSSPSLTPQFPLFFGKLLNSPCRHLPISFIFSLILTIVTTSLLCFAPILQFSSHHFKPHLYINIIIFQLPKISLLLTIIFKT